MSEYILSNIHISVAEDFKKRSLVREEVTDENQRDAKGKAALPASPFNILVRH